MDTLLRQLDGLQGKLYDLEEFLEIHRDNEVLEFLSEHWKECIFGGILVGFGVYKVHSKMIVSFLFKIDYFMKVVDFFAFRFDHVC